MNVRKSAQQPDPNYPSQRQFSDYKRLLGVAAIGLSAITGWAGPAQTGAIPQRTGGKMVTEPRQVTPPPACASTNAAPSEGISVPGDMRVAPRAPAGTPPVVPLAATNVIPATTATNTAALRLRGEMPAP